MDISFAHENMEYKWAIQDEITDIPAGGYGCDAYCIGNTKQYKGEQSALFCTRYTLGVTRKRKYKSRYVRFVSSNAIILVKDLWVDAKDFTTKDFSSFRHFIVIPENSFKCLDRMNGVYNQKQEKIKT